MTVAIVGGMLVLMAFLMGFSIVINQHGDWKAMVVEEANAVGAAYFRAGFIVEFFYKMKCG